MKYNKFTLAFSESEKGLEERFHEYYFKRCLAITRFSLLVGLFFYAIFGILDFILLPEVHTTTWLIRYAGVCPIVLFSFLATYHKNYVKYWQGSLILVISSAAAGIIAMIIIAPLPGKYSYYAGLILVIIFCYTFFRPRFLWAFLTCWGIVVAYQIVAVWLIKTPFSILINNDFFFIGANVAGMFACYSIEYHERKNFYLVSLLQDEKAKVLGVNKKLEEKIEELKEASSKIKTLSGLLPICARCKKIRNDNGYWSRLEEYIRENSEIQFSHGICPDCARELYPELIDEETQRS